MKLFSQLFHDLDGLTKTNERLKRAYRVLQGSRPGRFDLGLLVPFRKSSEGCCEDQRA